MLDLVKGLLEPQKFVLFSSSLWAEISSWLISVQKQLKKKISDHVGTILWVIRELCNCSWHVSRYQIQSGWFSEGYRMSSVWYGPWISHHALNVSLQRIPSVCFFHCLMSRFPKHVCNDQIYAFMTEVWGNVAIPAWLNVMDCIVFTA